MNNFQKNKNPDLNKNAQPRYTNRHRKIQFSVQFHPILLARINEYCVKNRRPRNFVIEEFLYRWFMPEFPCMPLQDPKEMTYQDQMTEEKANEIDSARRFKPRFGKRTDPLGAAAKGRIDDSVIISNPDDLTLEAMIRDGVTIMPEPTEEELNSPSTLDPSPETDPEMYNPEGGVAPKYDNPPLNENADMF